MEVKIIKIGEILRGINDKKPTMMIVEDSNETIKNYLDILKNNVKDNYTIIKTSGIIRQPTKSRYTSKILSEEPLVGIETREPIIGESYSIDYGTWSTTTVLDIIDDIIITKNSVYLIDSLSKERDRKLKKLGI